MPAPGAAGEPVFVGREHLLADMVRELDEGSHLRADDLSGPVGMGKSALLVRAMSTADAQRGGGAFAAHLIDIDDYDPGCPGDTGDTISLGAIKKNYDALKRLGREVLGSLQPELLARFDAAVETAFKRVLETDPAALNIVNRLEAGANATVENATVTVNAANVNLMQQVTAAWQRAGLQVAEEFVDCLNVVAGDRPLLLLIDNVDRISNQEIGTWLRGVLENLQRAVIVMTHEPEVSLELPPGLGSTMKLAPLTEDEVGEYLRRRPIPDGSPDLARLVHAYSGGRPVVVGLVHDLILDPDSGLTIEELSDGLVRLPADPEDRLAVVVQDMVKRFEGKLLEKALMAASVPRYLDAELLARLLEEGFGEHDLDLPKIMRDLESFSFIEEFTAGAKRVHYVRVHPFIRRGVVEQIRDRERSGVYTDLHECAARYFFDKVISEDRDYGEMFNYEDPEQQEITRQWLYHLARCAEVEHALLQVSRVFLDAFWWWGNYVHFNFCEEVATDLRNLATETGSADARLVANAVRTILDQYPKRSLYRLDADWGRYPDADWDAVEKALLRIQDKSGLEDWSDSWTTLQQRVAALIEIFLAHCYRYRGTMPEQAAEHYGTASDILAAIDEAAASEATDAGDAPNAPGWDRAWVAFERADLAFECDQIEDALAGCTEAAGLAYQAPPDMREQEVIANIHRLRGDCLWNSDDREAAAGEYGAAVMHSYLFQASSSSEAPDEYTMQFYFETRGRALEKFLRAWGEDEDQGVRIAQVLQEVVPRREPVAELSKEQMRQLVEGSLLDLANTLFPAGPDVADLYVVESDFMDQVRRIRQDGRKRFDRDLLVPPDR